MSGGGWFCPGNVSSLNLDFTSRSLVVGGKLHLVYGGKPFCFFLISVEDETPLPSISPLGGRTKLYVKINGVTSFLLVGVG